MFSEFIIHNCRLFCQITTYCKPQAKITIFKSWMKLESFLGIKNNGVYAIAVYLPLFFLHSSQQQQPFKHSPQSQPQHSHLFFLGSFISITPLIDPIIHPRLAIFRTGLAVSKRNDKLEPIAYL